jgi:hypothetical protein
VTGFETKFEAMLSNARVVHQALVVHLRRLIDPRASATSSFWSAGDAWWIAPRTALVSSTRAGRDPRTVKHEQNVPNGFDTTDEHIVMLYVFLSLFFVRSSLMVVNADSDRYFLSRAAARGFPALQLDIDTLHGERSALRCTQKP